MSAYQKTENAKIAATGTANYATFDGVIRELHIISDGDCFIAFDENVATTSSYLIKSGTEVQFTFTGGGPKKVWAITSGGSVNVYILAIR